MRILDLIKPRWLCFVPDGDGGAGGAGGQGDGDKVTKAELKAQLATANDRIAKLEHDIPGLVTRKAAELIEERLKTVQGGQGGQGGDGDKGKKGKDTTPSADERLAKLEAELAERDKRAIDAERRSSVAEAFQGTNFIADGAGEHARNTLGGMLQRGEDGKWFATMERKLPATGETITEKVSPAEAAKRLNTANSWWLKGNPQGGTGASGNGSAAAAGQQQSVDFESLKWKDLKGNPALMARAIKEKGQAWVNDRQNKALNKKGLGPGAGGFRPVAE